MRSGKKIMLTEDGRHLCTRAQELFNLAKKKFITRSDISALTLLISTLLPLQNEFQGWLGKQLYDFDIFGTYNLLSTAAEVVNGGDAAAIAIKGAAKTFGDSLDFYPLYPELTTTSVPAWKKYNVKTEAVDKFTETAKCICEFIHEKEDSINQRAVAFITAEVLAAGLTSCGSNKNHEKTTFRRKNI